MPPMMGMQMQMPQMMMMGMPGMQMQMPPMMGMQMQMPPMMQMPPPPPGPPPQQPPPPPGPPPAGSPQPQQQQQQQQYQYHQPTLMLPGMTLQIPLPPPMPVIVAEAKPETITTVYVGKIAATVEDEFVKALLTECGSFKTWRRIADPVTGKLKGFGFCDYTSPEGVLLALGVLNGLTVDGSALLVKVDDKTACILEDYKEEHPRKPLENGEASPEDKLKARVSQMMQERAKVMEHMPRHHESPELPTIQRPINTDMEKDELISREIQAFRENALRERRSKEAAEPDKENRDRDHDRDHDRDRRDRDRDYRDRDRDRDHRDRDRDRDRRRSRHDEDNYSRRSSGKDKSPTRKEADADKEKEKGKEEKPTTPQQPATAIASTSPTAVASPAPAYPPNSEEAILEQRRLAAEQRLRQAHESGVEQRLREELQSQARGQYGSFVQFPIGGDEEHKSLGFSLGGAGQKRPKTLVPGFTDDDETSVAAPVLKRRRELIRLDEPLGSASQLDIKQLVGKIPTDKDSLFAYAVDWATVDSSGLVENRLRPWITKKISEYMGEEEETLINFVVSKLKEHTQPGEILQQLEVVLDNEAEMFVIKLWRMLIFEVLRATEEGTEPH
eukprot:TRINITY_DN380_c0_g1_i2.p1 TRINITY_DN380_c0_g1~~TRINITY_DN380_c0_g1_i2.p1  ORF type:complete len:720 (+),score=230.24 TRINITY_DN380_c0_g1_i2:316-2160(+)